MIRVPMVILLFLALGVPYFVSGATLYMDPTTAEINRGDTISIGVRLDTDEDECINVVDGVITYSENIQPIDISRGNSIFSIWVEEPIINRDNRTITFAGGIPNGYCGRIIGDPRLTNTLVELVFSSPGLQVGSTESGNVATIAFADGTRALLNDGFGTDARLNLYDANITLSPKAGNQVQNSWGDRVGEDTVPPQQFSIDLQRTKNAFSNRYFIVFNTTDKESGIDYYEVIEESMEDSKLFRWGAVDAPWVKASSPYVLNDQSLNSTIRVRAYDKAGNEYVATYVPEESVRSITNSSKVMIALIGSILVLFVFLLLFTMFWLQRTRTRSVKLDESSDVGSKHKTHDKFTD